MSAIDDPTADLAEQAKAHELSPPLKDTSTEVADHADFGVKPPTGPDEGAIGEPERPVSKARKKKPRANRKSKHDDNAGKRPEEKPAEGPDLRCLNWVKPASIALPKDALPEALLCHSVAAQPPLTSVWQAEELVPERS